MPPANGGTFQPLLHRSGTLRERLHSYTKRTLGAGGSINEAVSEFVKIAVAPHSIGAYCENGAENGGGEFCTPNKELGSSSLTSDSCH